MNLCTSGNHLSRSLACPRCIGTPCNRPLPSCTRIGTPSKRNLTRISRLSRLSLYITHLSPPKRLSTNQHYFRPVKMSASPRPSHRPVLPSTLLDASPNHEGGIIRGFTGLTSSVFTRRIGRGIFTHSTVIASCSMSFVTMNKVPINASAAWNAMLNSTEFFVLGVHANYPVRSTERIAKAIEIPASAT